ncbi:hypothetical protein ACIQHY_14320 [Streptomyces sp. NPDC092359]|uniref:hypothetical protein n=1 Tax=Streptomyces sp. NPDC092359 TaxID=3366014 RepID=UPI00380B0AD6
MDGRGAGPHGPRESPGPVAPDDGRALPPRHRPARPSGGDTRPPFVRRGAAGLRGRLPPGRASDGVLPQLLARTAAFGGRLWGNGTEGCGTPARPSPVGVRAVAGGTPRTPTVGRTALRIDLAAPPAYGKRASVSFDVPIAVPDRVHRFGGDGAYRFPGNALPLLPVRDARGPHLDPDVDFGESFLTLAGDFRVVLDHPTALVVPSTGTTTRRAGAPGRTVTTGTSRAGCGASRGRRARSVRGR